MRILVGLAGALLGASLLVPPTSDAAAGTQQVRTVHRAYGDGPVRLGRADVLKIQFKGKGGDRVRVRLDGENPCYVSLRGPRGKRVTKLSMGFWRLPRAAPYTFSIRHCDRLSSNDRVQLEKLRVRKLVTNGNGERLGTTRGFVDAVRVEVHESGRLKLFGTDPRPGFGPAFAGMVLPDGTWYHTNWNTYYFENGSKISDVMGPLSGAGGNGSLRTRGGDEVVVVVDSPLTVWQSTAIPVRTTVDGPSLTLPASRVPYREYQVKFDAAADSWLHPELIWPGTGVPGFAGSLGSTGAGSYWHITAARQHSVTFFTHDTTEPTQLRIRTITQLTTPVPVDGSHLTLTSDDPGEWVMVPMTLSDTGASFYRMTVHSFTATGPWTALVTGQTRLHCGPRSGNGCGDWSMGQVSPEYLTTAPFGTPSGLPNPWMVLLRPDPVVTASVEISFSPSTSTGAIS